MTIESRVANTTSALVEMLDQNIRSLTDARERVIAGNLPSEQILGTEGVRMDKAVSDLTLLHTLCGDLGMSREDFAACIRAGAARFGTV